MSGVLDLMMELEEANLSSIPNKSLCVDHIDDSSIKFFIRKNYRNGYCDYCNKDRKTIELEELMFHIISFINKEYTDAANVLGYDSEVGGYIGTTMNERELLWETNLNINSNELYEDVVNSIADISWVEQDYYGTNEFQELAFRWKAFKGFIKHKNRFLLYDPKNRAFKQQKEAKDTLKQFGSSIKRFNLIQTIDEGHVIYRCRATTKRKYFKNVEELVSPPNNLAKYSNRFSPAGISFFYGSFNKKTALNETVVFNSKKNTYVSIAKFITTKKLRILNLTALPNLYSFFSTMRGKKYYERLFLHHIVSDMSKAILKDGMEHIDYVPTQVITEFIRFVFKDKSTSGLDGIIYPSSKGINSKCIVIFSDYDDSLSHFELVDVLCKRIENGKDFL